MDRRTFLKTTTAAAAATTATAGAVQAKSSLQAPAIITARHEFQITVPVPPHLADPALDLMRDIAIASGGRILLHRAEPTAGASVDGIYWHLTEFAGAHFALFTGLPGDMAVTPLDLLAWLSAAGGALYLDEAAAERDLKAIPAGHSGAEIGLWSTQPVPDLDAFSAAFVRSTALGRNVIAELTHSHSVSGRADGTVEIREIAAQPLQALAELREPQRRYWYRDGLHQQGTATSLILTRDAWHKLAPADHLLIEAVATAALHRTLAAIRASNSLMAPTVLASLPVIRKPLPTSIDTAIRQVATSVTYEEMAKTRQMTAAFEAYGAFFEAVTGAPLPRPSSSSPGALS